VVRTRGRLCQSPIVRTSTDRLRAGADPKWEVSAQRSHAGNDGARTARGRRFACRRPLGCSWNPDHRAQPTARDNRSSCSSGGGGTPEAGLADSAG